MGARRFTAGAASIAALLALAVLVPAVSAQMGAVDRPVDPRLNPFLVTGSLAPAEPAPGETVEVAAEIRSRVHPHIRVVVAFWIDGHKREEQSYVIAPFAESIVVHEWVAEPGAHAVRIEVSSPAGVRYTGWEQRITVRGR